MQELISGYEHMDEATRRFLKERNLHIDPAEPPGYYDLIEFERIDTGEIYHIPVPILIRKGAVRFVVDVWYNAEHGNRTEDFFQCPLCGNGSFFAGICNDCLDLIEGGDAELALEASEYYRREARRAMVKGGIVSAIVKGKKLRNYIVRYVEA